MIVGSDFVLNALAEEGLTHLFMVPGGLVDPFLPALARVPQLRPIVAAHEGGAAYMADGYARASGRFGAVLGIGGPGLTNMTTAVAAAKTDASPVLVLSGEIPLDMEGLGEFQDASQTTLDDTAVMKPITRLSETVASPRSLNHALRRATHGDVGAAPGSGAPVADPRCADRDPRRGLRPGFPIFQGGDPAERARRDCGASQPCAAARRSHSWPAPASSTTTRQRCSRRSRNAGRSRSRRRCAPRACFPEDHALSLGVFGYAGTRHATAAILADPPDVLIVLGSGFNERDTMHWTLRGRTTGKTTIIHVNTDMETLTTHGTPGHVVPGSSGAFLELLLREADAIAPSLAADAGTRRAWLAEIKQGPRLYDVENRTRGQRSRSIRPRPSRRCARSIRATAWC